MIVIADSSPLIVLVNIGHIEILPRLFKSVVIPPAVAAEIAAPHRPQTVKDFANAKPSWLSVQTPMIVHQFPLLHQGECEAISLAMELHADLLLIDERRAYREAAGRNINAVGTIRVLERAAAEGMLNLRDAFLRLRQTDFWITDKFLAERLRLFEVQRVNKPPM
jgi:predicted nucleic acid-binding protein